MITWSIKPTTHWALRISSRILPLLASLLLSHTASATIKNGFDLSESDISPQHIYSGGPPKDGIPSIDSPQYSPAFQSSFLKPQDRVLGVVINGQAKAFPVSILNWHEIVNDHNTDFPFVITYCPLCGTGMAFIPPQHTPALASGLSAGTHDSKPSQFGVSGLLYNSDVLFYDRDTESLWSQLLGKAISGPLRGSRLEALPLAHTTWAHWRKQHPQTLVLNRNTGYPRNYNKSPYQGYERSRAIFFPVQNRPMAVYHPKEQVLGVQISDQFKAYPYVELAKYKHQSFKDSVNHQEIEIIWNEEHQFAKALDAQGREIPTVVAYWFAWFAFHPQTQVFQAGQ